MRTRQFKFRDIGITTEQLKMLPDGGVFIWGNRDITYPKRLAIELGRPDITIVSVGWLDGSAWRGKKLSGIIADHAAELSKSQNDTYKHIRYYTKYDLKYNSLYDIVTGI